MKDCPFNSKQKEFQLSASIRVSSNFESGNLSDCKLSQNNHMKLWIGCDPNSTYRTWFYFSVEGVVAGAIMHFTIMNMSNQVKLFKEGLVPVYRVGSDPSCRWQKLKIGLAANAVNKGQNGYEVAFKHQFMGSTVHYFALTYPWTVTSNDQFIHKNIRDLNDNKDSTYFCKYEQLCMSFRKRNVMILTMTSRAGQRDMVSKISLQELQDSYQTNTDKIEQIEHGQSEPSKKIWVSDSKIGVFVSARVHPGEVASSYILNGLLTSLFSNSSQAKLLLEHCIFYIVPIINPDGVSEGNFRTDSRGKNLNRFYANPNPVEQPEIYGIKQFLIPMIKSKRIDFCLDLHAHVNKQGSFMYGNSISQLKGQMQVCLLAKIMEFNCQYFDYENCNFSENNMSSKDKGDDFSKEGAARVAIYKQTGLNRCWTLQCNYNSSKSVNLLPAYTSQNKNSSVSHGILCQKVCPDIKNTVKLFQAVDFQQIGHSIFESIMDFYEMNSLSRIYGSGLKNSSAFRVNTAICALRLLPFCYDARTRKLFMNISSKMEIKETLSKISRIVNSSQVCPFDKVTEIASRPSKSRNISLTNRLQNKEQKETETAKPIIAVPKPNNVKSNAIKSQKHMTKQTEQRPCSTAKSHCRVQSEQGHSQKHVTNSDAIQQKSLILPQHTRKQTVTFTQPILTKKVHPTHKQGKVCNSLNKSVRPICNSNKGIKMVQDNTINKCPKSLYRRILEE